MRSATSLMIFGGSSSGPHDLFESREFRIFRTSRGVITKELKVGTVLTFSVLGSYSSFTSSSDCFVKCSFKSVALSLSSVVMLPSVVNNGGITCKRIVPKFKVLGQPVTLRIGQ